MIKIYRQNDLIALTNLKGFIIYCSNQCAQLFGYPKADILGKSLFRYLNSSVDVKDFQSILDGKSASNDFAESCLLKIKSQEMIWAEAAVDNDYTASSSNDSNNSNYLESVSHKPFSRFNSGNQYHSHQHQYDIGLDIDNIVDERSTDSPTGLPLNTPMISRNKKGMSRASTFSPTKTRIEDHHSHHSNSPAYSYSTGGITSPPLEEFSFNDVFEYAGIEY